MRTSRRSLHADQASIKRLLVDQIVKPVRWEQTMQALVADGDGAVDRTGSGSRADGIAEENQSTIAGGNAGVDGNAETHDRVIGMMHD